MPKLSKNVMFLLLPTHDAISFTFSSTTNHGISHCRNGSRERYRVSFARVSLIRVTRDHWHCEEALSVEFPTTVRQENILNHSTSGENDIGKRNFAHEVSLV